MLQLRLLGSPQILLNGLLIADLAWGKSQALLFYLAMNGRSQSRLALAGLLWPEKSDEEARTTLRQAVRTLAKAMPTYIDASRGDLMLNPDAPVRVDALRFEAEAKQGLAGDVSALQRAADAYAGDFLAGFYVDDAVDFEEWMLRTRERLHGLALQVLHQLAVYYVQRREIAAGLIYTQRLLALEPWREETHQQLMRLFAWDGQFSAALAQYHHCCRLLQAEFGATPTPETTALYERIQRLRTSRRQNLPPETTSLVGRSEEVACLSQWLHQPDGRLITLLGPGGIGKTRVAQAVAYRQISVFLEGVFWVELSEVTTADGLVAALAGALDMPLSGKVTAQSQLLDFLRNKELLLVLDSFERLLDDNLAGSIQLLQQLLQKAPAVSLLITSRVQLNLRQERLFLLPPLPYPTRTDAPDLAHYAAVQLFDQCAQRVWQHFQLTAEAPAVAEICRLVEGLPLGVELAAGLVQTQPCADIARAIAATLDSLASHWHDLPPRQRSLRAAFEYSFHLLPPPAQQLLPRLAVFPDGFTLEAGQTIAGATLNLLATLVAHSLVQRGSAGRYTLHEVIRQFARSTLAQEPAGEQRVQQAFCDYFTGQVQQHAHQLRRADPQKAQVWFAGELNNILAAWQWAVDQADLAGIERCLDGLSLYFARNGPFAIAERLFTTAQNALQARQTATTVLPVASHHLLGRLMVKRAELLHLQGRYAETVVLAQTVVNLGEQLAAVDLEAEGHLLWSWALRVQGAFADAHRQSLAARAAAEQAQLPLVMAKSLMNQGEIAIVQGRYEEAEALLRAALTIYQEANDLAGLADLYNRLSSIYLTTADLPKAQAALEESHALARQLGFRGMEATTLINLGIVFDFRGEYDHSRTRYEQARLLAQALGDHELVLAALTNLGMVAHLVGDYRTAHDYYQQALTLLHINPSHNKEGIILANLALLAHHTGDQVTALRYSQQVLQLAETLNSTYLKAYGLTFAAHADHRLNRLTVAAEGYEQAIALRRAMGEAHLAMESLAGLARVLLTQGDVASARQAVEEILAYLSRQPQAEGTDEPLRLYLTCYQVLRAQHDPRAAELLATAHQLLQERAARLHDAQLRHSFLHNIVTHRTLVAEYERQVANQSAGEAGSK